MNAHARYLTKNSENKVAQALGSDSVFYLDGRNTISRQMSDAKKQMEKLSAIHPFWIGFELRRGDLRSSRVIRVWLIEEEY